MNIDISKTVRTVYISGLTTIALLMKRGIVRIGLPRSQASDFYLLFLLLRASLKIKTAVDPLTAMAMKIWPGMVLMVLSLQRSIQFHYLAS